MSHNHICPTCGQRIVQRTAKVNGCPPELSAEDRAKLTDAELHAYYKARAPYDDLAFFLRADLSPELRARAERYQSHSLTAIKTAMPTLRALWRREKFAADSKPTPPTPPTQYTDWTMKICKSTVCTCGHSESEHENGHCRPAYAWDRKSTACECPRYQQAAPYESWAWRTVPAAQYLAKWTRVVGRSQDAPEGA